MQHVDRYVPANNNSGWGVATGTASALLPGLKFASHEQAGKIYQQVEVRKVERM